MGGFQTGICGSQICLFSLTLLTGLLLDGGGVATMPPLPERNVWLMLAEALNESMLCLSMTSPGDPFQTCLVAIPLVKSEWDVLFNLTVRREYTAMGRIEPT